MNHLSHAVVLSLATAFLTHGAARAADVAPVTLTWLGGSSPASPSGVSWGVPWPRGSLPKGTPLTVRTADGRSVATQDWPLAFWPDGSVKWSGLAIAADGQLAAPLTVAVGSTSAPESPLRVQEDANGFELSTGTLRCRIARSGSNLIESLVIDGREVGRNGRLIAIREDRSAFESKGLLRQEHYTSRVSKVTVEQSGPVRAVVRIEGMHADENPNTERNLRRNGRRPSMNRRPFNTSQPSASMKTTIEICGAFVSLIGLLRHIVLSAGKHRASTQCSDQDARRARFVVESRDNHLPESLAWGLRL